MIDKKYSIIIPHYNSIKKLKILINSIGYREDIEVLIVDDKSTKEIQKELKKYVINIQNKNFIKLYFNEGIKSAGSCRNIGIDNAIGKWLIFADADDYFLENFLNILDRNMDENYEIIYFIPKSFYENTNLEAKRHEVFEKLIQKYLKNKTLKNIENLKYKFVVPWSKAIKNDYIKENKIYYDEIIASNDVMFSLKSAKNTEKINVIPEKIYAVTVSKGSLTQRFNKSIFEARLKNALDSNRFFKENNIKNQNRIVLLYLIKSLRLGRSEFFKTFKLIVKMEKNIFVGIYLESLIIFIKNFFYDKNNKKKYFVDEFKK